MDAKRRKLVEMCIEYYEADFLEANQAKKEIYIKHIEKDYISKEELDLYAEKRLELLMQNQLEAMEKE